MDKVSEIPVTQQQGAGMYIRHVGGRPTFGIACWFLALIAFAQLIMVGTALTVRSGQTEKLVDNEKPPVTTVSFSQPIQPRSLDQILADVDDGPLPSYNSQTVPVPSVRSTPQPIPRATGPSHQLSAIADPRVERLVQDARALQLEGDMMRAMVKLDEAGRVDSSEPAVFYYKALLFEEMGILTKAADHYQQIQQMGIKAGNYYRLAAAKLIQGMGKGIQKNDLVIGHMKTRKANGTLTGKHVDVSITLIARPDRMIDADDVEVNVYFYDRLNGGEIRRADATAEITNTWADDAVNWHDVGNEETLNVTYTIPEADLADVHLLGRKEYYGYVVELLYKGDVIDQQAQPRRLHNIHGGQKSRSLSGDFFGDPLNDFPLGVPDDGGDLLPGIDAGYGSDPTVPPLPRR